MSRLVSRTPPADATEVTVPLDRKERLKRLIISAFLLFHIVAITFWVIPIGSPFISVIREGVRPYLVWSGLFQSWNMFAPEPLKVNSYVEAQVTYADGRNKIWKFPRVQYLSYRERYFKERYRKYLEYLTADANSAMWPDAARHVARINNEAGNPPTVVILIRYWSEMEAPAANGAFRSKPWKGVGFFVYLVRPEDLK